MKSYSPRFRFASGLLLAWLITAGSAWAAGPPMQLDRGFAPMVANAGGGVSALALQPDGKVLVAGTFQIIGGRLRPGLARLLANGSVDDTFNPGEGLSGITTLVVQPDAVDGSIAGVVVKMPGIELRDLAPIGHTGRGNIGPVFTAIPGNM